ncbi:MAG: asparaginase [Clostridia bacterium]|nr:asparaginase [Clostridia bacterium]
MKKILFIPVGGTICTALNDNGHLSINSNAGNLLIHYFETSGSFYAGKVNIDIKDNLNILSENMTVECWNKIIKAYLTYTDTNNYDGIIFAHGTDTLAYSASLFSMLLSGINIPVFFVSANARPDKDGSNANINFKCAVECICNNTEPNVYIAYQNPSDKKMYIHLASRLEQCKNYSEDFFSFGMTDITEREYNPTGFSFNNDKKPCQIENNPPLISSFNNKQLKQCVLMIEPYVGIDYNTYNYEMFDAILHTSYHSNTVCTNADFSNSVIHMLNKCNNSKSKPDVYFSPMKFDGEIYDSLDILESNNITALYGLTKETAYAKLLIAYSLFNSKNEIITFLETELNHEYIL